ncbi:MAG: lipoyl synthase [Candidatus Omnitrophota bacterium]
MYIEKRRPSWLKKRLVLSDNVKQMKSILSGVDTVCESSLCPNLNECYSRMFATFLILGANCTRACSFCSVDNNVPKAVDPKEPKKIVSIVKKIGLKYVVITSVTRDDLPDGGASQFARVVRSLKRYRQDIKVEVLVPDFNGNKKSLEKVFDAGPDIFGHNTETVKRLYPLVRRGADYTRSLDVLRAARDFPGRHLVKSALMLGLGETDDETIAAMTDIRKAGCDILTIGQYLRPRMANMPVSRYLKLPEFEKFKQIGRGLGFKYVSSGPFVRSSYFAEEAYFKCINAPGVADERVCGIMMLARL